MPKELMNQTKIHHSTRLETLKAGVALKVGEKAASNLTPLHARVENEEMLRKK